MHNKTTRPLTASERIRLARRIDQDARAKLIADRRKAREKFRVTL